MLLWLTWYIRARHPLELPVFVDESLHIMRGKVVWSFSDLGESLIPKKLLYYYWLGLFGLNASESLWLARMSTALAALPGAALTYGLARRLFDRRAGLLALALYTLAPFMIFFERMALSDAFTAVFCTALAWASIDFARRPTLRRGAGVGALAGLAGLAKLIALPVIALPLLAIPLFGPPTPLRPRAMLRAVWSPRYRGPLLLAALICVLLLTPSFSYVTYKELSGTKDRVVLEERLYTTDDRGEQIMSNLGFLSRALAALLGPEMVVVAGGLAAYLAWRRSRAFLYLAAAVLLPWTGVILTAGSLSTRYLVLGIPPLLALVAGGLFDVTDWVAAQRKRHRKAQAWTSVLRLHWAAWVLLVVWAATFAVPFIWYEIHDPVQLDLAMGDEREYFTAASSGYGLRDLAADLPTLTPAADGKIYVIGFVPACHSLPLYWTTDNAVALECPLFKWDISQQQAMTDRLIALVEAHPLVYMAVEPVSVYDVEQLPFEWELLADYPRPNAGPIVQLYRVTLEK